MNKTLSILAALLVMTSTTFATAPDEPASRISVLKKGETIKLLYKGEEQNDVKVIILNEKNDIVYTEKIKSTQGFIRPYNFSQLPQGNYSFELIDNKGRQVEQVKYQIDRENRVIHVSRVAGTSNKFVLSVPSKNPDKLSVTIYNALNGVLYSGTEDISGDFARVYNLENYSGQVTFEVTDSKGRTKSLTKQTL